MTGLLGTRSCSLIYRDKLGARLGRSELIYLLVSLEQYTAEDRDGPWEFYYTRRIAGRFQPPGR